MERLVEDFEYDAWANRQWLQHLNSKALGDPDMGIFRHILAAQETWCQRCNGLMPEWPPAVETSEAAITDLNERWISLLKGRSDDPVIAYKRYTGEPQQLRMSQIARHVVDHGAYHRGELRGLCRARNEEDFPETGRVIYFLLPRN